MNRPSTTIQPLSLLLGAISAITLGMLLAQIFFYTDAGKAEAAR